MPAPEVLLAAHYPRPVLNHVSLMLDTYLANATVEDLRSSVRGLLASGTQEGLASAFGAAARKHLCESGALIPPNPQTLFIKDSQTRTIRPTETLKKILARARTVYGAGLGFDSLEILTPMVEATIGAEWAADGETAEILAEIDADIVQAIQSCKEELETDRVMDRDAVRQIVSKLQRAIHESSADGRLPFEKADCSIQYWKF